MNTNSTTVSGPNITVTAREDRLAQAHALLEQGLADVQQDPEALARYLRFRAHFRQYSFHNTLLIMAQRPGARFVKGFAAWREVGRRVKKGEKGLAILAPVLRRPTEEEARLRRLDPEKDKVVSTFRVTYVWDITQTEVIPEWGNAALQYESPIPRLRGDDHIHLFEALCKVAHRRGFKVVRYDDRLEDGFCSLQSRTIGFRADLGVNDACAVLAHELAHAVAHEDAKDLTHAAAELKAEGAAFALCYALGLDTRRASFPYLKWYEQKGEPIAEQLAEIDRIANELLVLIRAE